MLLAVRDFSFHDATQRLMKTIGSRKLWYELLKYSFLKGKEDFTESVTNTEAIRKQRSTFAERKEKQLMAKVERC